MTTPVTEVWTTRSGEETEALAGRLLGTPSRRSQPCRVVTLRGELGTGKSTFARGALRALGAHGPIKSPSYTLLEIYELPAVHVVHLDLYRLNDPDELEHLGLADYYRPGYLWLDRMAGKGGGQAPGTRPALRLFHRE